MSHRNDSHLAVIKRCAIRRMPAALLGIVLLASTTAADARATAEQRCQMKRYDARARYAFCQERALARHYGGLSEGVKYNEESAKCLATYTAVWPKLAIPGTTCDRERFEYDGQTVRDHLTGLQWEVKTDDGSVRDKDNSYTWGTGGEGTTAATGTVFTSFLATLNGTCFAGQCDWRLPIPTELQTILLEPYPCTLSPCIATTLFGPTISGFFWSSRSSATDQFYVLGVVFHDGFVSSDDKSSFSLFPARAVRADW